MQQLELNMPKRRFIGKLGIILIIAIILLTFLSKTINNSLMPKVTTVQFVKGSLQESFEAEGTVELSGKRKVLAGGSWKVEEVAVKADQQVKKGDVLAVMNERDILIELKTLEHDLIKLENDLQYYKNSYEPIRLSDYERELQLAQKDADDAKKQLDMTKELYQAGLETLKNLEDAENDYNDKLYKYQIKKETLEDKKKESVCRQDEFNRTVNEKTAELELKKMLFEKKSGNLTEDGKILSDMDGLITAVNVEPGMSTSLNQVMFEIANMSNPYRVTWYLNAEKASGYAIGDEVNLKITGEVIEEDKTVIKSETVKVKIAGKEFVAGSDKCKYWTDIGRGKNGIKVAADEGQKAEVWAVINSPIYNYLLPKNGVTQIQGKYYIYEVKKRKGALGTEDYAVQTEVEIIDEDDFYVAVNGFFRNDDKVVVNTTKSLADGVRVHVR